MRFTLGLILLIAFFCSCQQRNYKTFTVKGSIKNAPAKIVSLISFGSNNNAVVLDTSALDAKGNFKLKTLSNDEELYAVVIGNSTPIWLVNDAETVILNADLQEYKNYAIQGSVASIKIHQFIARFDSLLEKQKSLAANIDSLKQQKAKDSLMDIAKNDSKLFRQTIKNFCSNAVASTTSPAAKCFYLFYFFNSKAIEENEAYIMIKDVAKQFPKHTQLQGLKERADMVAKERPRDFMANQVAADFNYIDKDSNKVSLKTFAGKYLLIDFWQSSNKVYQREIPYLVETYKLFKDKNFEMISIALDSNKAAWHKAILRDSLNWRQVLDTLGLQSPTAKKFYADSLPYNILISPSSKIIAVNLRGEALREKLKDLCN